MLVEFDSPVAVLLMLSLLHTSVSYDLVVHPFTYERDTNILLIFFPFLLHRLIQIQRSTLSKKDGSPKAFHLPFSYRFGPVLVPGKKKTFKPF